MLTVLATLDGQPIFLAQPDVQTTPTDGTTGGDSTTTTQKQPGLFDSPLFLIMIVGMMVIWIFLLGGGSRKQRKKQRKKQQEMLASITKGSKVVTIGGIKGSVVELREDEVVLKVDENNNTRMKFSRDAIRSVLDGSSAAAVKDEKEAK